MEILISVDRFFTSELSVVKLFFFALLFLLSTGAAFGQISGPIDPLPENPYRELHGSSRVRAGLTLPTTAVAWAAGAGGGILVGSLHMKSKTTKTDADTDLESVILGVVTYAVVTPLVSAWMMGSRTHALSPPGSGNSGAGLTTFGIGAGTNLLMIIIATEGNLEPMAVGLIVSPLLGAALGANRYRNWLRDKAQTWDEANASYTQWTPEVSIGMVSIPEGGNGQGMAGSGLSYQPVLKLSWSLK